VPEGSSAVVYISSDLQNVSINDRKAATKEKDGKYSLYRVDEGDHIIRAN